MVHEAVQDLLDRHEEHGYPATIDPLDSSNISSIPHDPSANMGMLSESDPNLMYAADAHHSFVRASSAYSGTASTGYVQPSTIGTIIHEAAAAPSMMSTTNVPQTFPSGGLAASITGIPGDLEAQLFSAKTRAPVHNVSASESFTRQGLIQQSIGQPIANVPTFDNESLQATSFTTKIGKLGDESFVAEPGTVAANPFDPVVDPWGFVQAMAPDSNHRNSWNGSSIGGWSVANC